MDENEIRQRIIDDRKAGKIRYSALAKLCGIGADQFSKSVSGVRSFKPAELDTLRRFYGIVQVNEVERPHYLPVVGRVSAGNWREGFEHVIERIPSPDRSVGRNAFIVIVDGDSMDKIAPDGTHVVVDPDDRRLINEKMYIIRNGGGETTFKCYRDNPSRLEPLSSNAEHKTIFPGDDGFEVIGRVTTLMQIRKV